MQITAFDYELPDELIAQEPLKNRADSKMLVINRQAETWQDDSFSSFPQFLNETDILVLNNTKVFPARLLGKSETGAQIELFLVKEIENQVWETLARPARRLKTGKKILFDDLTAEVLEKTDEGRVIASFQTSGRFNEVIDKIGKTPLPPYIKRDEQTADEDRARYQTVFAKNRGAIAAPTAGLHFTPEIIEKIKSRGVRILEITLHVGYGTFEPVRVSDLSEHSVMPEQSEITEETAQMLNEAKANKSRIIAVGTTTTRALESAASEEGKILAGKRSANLTITPGYKFRAIDGLLTNFHLPQSSLLVLVSTFAGHELIMNSYKHAVASKYRFYSFGDCSFIF